MSNERLEKGHSATAAVVDETFREHRTRILAALVRVAGDMEAAEDAVQDAFAAAASQWPKQGVPSSPASWIARVASNKAIDRIRRERLARDSRDTAGGIELYESPTIDPFAIEDDRLRLIFACCHPLLPAHARIALTLYSVCGIDAATLARAFLVPEETIVKRLVRARRQIRDERIPYEVPATDELAERLESALQVIYLIFNAGYDAAQHSGTPDLAAEAIRLARLLHALLASDAPTSLKALLALMLMHHARREARLDGAGRLVLLADQDRSRWKHDEIAEGMALLREAAGSPPGPYTLQAAIAAVHCDARSASETDWAQILALYDRLIALTPTNVARLNRAVALGMVRTPAAALHEMAALERPLIHYRFYYSTRAAMQEQCGHVDAALDDYRRALELSGSGVEREFLAGKIRGLVEQQETTQRFAS
jgi:RNA polymerase sigma-70 factor, ECF subfamily